MYGYSSSYSSNALQEYRPHDKDQPLDTVSSIIWDAASNDPAFIASSWDGHVRYYLFKTGMGSTNSSIEVEKAWSIFLQHPVLCCDITSDKMLFAGLATGDIAAVKMESSEVGRIGFHDAPICGVFWLKEKECLMSLGFDNLIRFWTLNGEGKHQH